mgnify:CR=1 FL=1
MPGKKNLRMKAARAAVGLSQADLAEAVGVTRQTIGLIEAGDGAAQVGVLFLGGCDQLI